MSTAITAPILFPAIDLRDGKVVRLVQGESDRQTVYATDPLEVAASFAEQGARWLHIVNLDGAFADVPDSNNRAAIERLLWEQRSLRIQIGGGLRTTADIERVLAMGCRRVILGSVAVEEPEMVARAIDRFGPESVVIGIDARGGVTGGEVRTRGWTEGSALTPLALAQRMVELGVETFVYTDIARDGMLSGPDVAGAAELAAATGAAVVVSGGVGSLDHLDTVHRLAESAAPGRLEGVIIGKALYDNVFSIKDALGHLRGR